MFILSVRKVIFVLFRAILIATFETCVGPTEPQLATPRLCVALDVEYFCHLSVAPLGGIVGKSRKRHMNIDMGDSFILFPLSTVRNYTWYGGQEKHTSPH